jgi:hypothetical protein
MTWRLLLELDGDLAGSAIDDILRVRNEQASDVIIQSLFPLQLFLFFRELHADRDRDGARVDSRRWLGRLSFGFATLL